LEDGEIVEQGTHQQLLGNDGSYAEMYNNQLLEEENV
jgi:ATP-binding cassette subfamily B protein